MIVAGVVVAVVLVVVVWAWVMYNRMIRGRTGVDGTWAQIEVELARRHDLIPNLLESVRGYAAHERTAFDSVTRARANALGVTGPGDRAEAEQAVSEALGRLFAVAESYPDLKADRSFAALQTELAATEDRIAASRAAYNDAVLGFNTMIQRVPMNLMAGAMGMVAVEYFEVRAEPRDPMGVQF